MRTTWSVTGVVTALALLAATAPAAPAPAETPRGQALALNEITGDDAVLGRIFELIEDGRHTKPLLEEAAKMAKEKDQPFNVNATWILARTAELLKQTDDSVAFYRLFLDQAEQLHSAEKISDGYAGLIETLYSGGKYEESEKACTEFLDLKGDAALQLRKPAVLRQMVLVLAKEGKTDKANELIDKIVKAQPDNPLNLMAKGQFLHEIGKPAEAVKAFGDAIDLVKKNEDLTKAEKDDFLSRIRQMVLVMAKAGKADQAAELMDKIIQARPDDPMNLIAKGQLLHEIDKPAEAVKAYEDAIDLAKKDADLTKEGQQDFINELRYAMSGLYVDLNQVDKAADDLKALLEKDPDNPGYNNDLGYIWADHDMNLSESEKLIRKALEEEKKQRLKANPELKADDVKENGSYLDSLGWVLFKEKKYKEALGPLEEAVKDPDAQSIEIYDHLAEVQMATGDKTAAVATWKKGLELPADTKREKQKKVEVEKKLKAME